MRAAGSTWRARRARCRRRSCPTLMTALFMCGRLAEAGQLLDGAIESARSSGIPQAVAWTLVNRANALHRVRRRGRGARVCGGELRAHAADRRTLRLGMVGADGRRHVAARGRSRAGGRGAGAGSGRAGARHHPRQLARVRSPAAHALPAWRSAATRRRASRSRSRRRPPDRWGCRWPTRGRTVPRRTSRSPPASTARPPSGRSRRRDCAEQAGAVIEEALSRTLAGQALALAGDRERALARAAARGDGARRVRRAAPARCRRARAAQARTSRAPALAQGQRRRRRRGHADRARAPSRRARRRPQDEPRLARQHSLLRVQGGSPIVQHQMMQHMLADMATQIEAARLLTHKAAATEPPQVVLSSMAKVFASDTAVKVATDAVQIMGAYGTTGKSGAEKYFRDAKMTQIFEGTNELCRLAITAPMLQYAGLGSIGGD